MILGVISSAIRKAANTVVTTKPTLTNFRIEASELSRVFFDATGNVTGMTTTGFVISGKTILSVTIDADGFGGYFAVSVPFTYWDNITIRLGHHTDTGDVNTKLHNFTLSYVVNNIVQPAHTAATWYVNGAVASSGNGTTEALAFKTIQEGLTALQPSGRLYIKAFDYGLQNITIADEESGTATAPTIIEGYKTTPGDITSNYWDYGIAFDPLAMPTLTGPGTGSGWYVRANNIIIRNVQAQSYSYNFSLSEAKSNIQFKNINGYNANINGTNGLSFNAGQANSSITRLRLQNAVMINGSEAMFQICAIYGLIEGCKAYDGSDDVTATSGDYYFQMQGNSGYTTECSYNIIRNCVAHKKNAAGFAGHGFGTKYRAEYNLFELNQAVNQTSAFTPRHSQCKYNVWKDSTNDNRNIAYKNTSTGCIKFISGAQWNIVENITSYATRRGLEYNGSDEDSTNSTVIADNNVVRNCIFNEMSEDWLYVTTTEPNTTQHLSNNKIYNCTVNNVAQYLFRLYYINGTYTTIIDPNNEIKNCSFSDITNHYRISGDLYQAPNFIQEANNYWDFWGTNGTPPAGTLNQSVNPLYADLVDFKPTTTFDTIDALRINGVWFDQDGKERAEMTTIGAVKHDSEIAGDVEPPAEYTPTRYVSSTTGNDANDGLTPETAWATLDKFDDMVLPDNTVVGLKRGDIFTGRISRSDKSTALIITAYGTGVKPILNNYTEHTLSFTPSGTANVWQTPAIGTSYPKRMWIDGVEAIGGQDVTQLMLGTDIPDKVQWYVANSTSPLYVYSTTDPSTKSFRYSDNQNTIVIRRSSNIILDNLVIKGGYNASTVLEDCANITIQNCDYLDSAIYGIVVDGYTIGSSDIKITNCNLDTRYELDFSEAGTYTGATSIGTSDAIIVYQCTGGEISNNTFRNWGHTGISLTAKTGGYVTQGFKVFDNYLTLDTNMTYGNGITTDRISHSHEIYNNTNERTKVSQFNGYNNHIHHNVFKNIIQSPHKDTDFTGHGIQIIAYAGTSHDNIIEHNIFDNCDSGGIDIARDANGDVYGHIFRNNIFYNCGTGNTDYPNETIKIGDNTTRYPHDLTFENNIIYKSNAINIVRYYNIGMNVETFNTQTSNSNLITENIAVAPLFVSATDYHLQSSSPAVNAGATPLATKDRDGNTIPFATTLPDIGGYESEYVGTDNTPNKPTITNIV